MIQDAPGRDERRLHQIEAHPAEQQETMNVENDRTMKSAGSDLRPIGGSKSSERDHQKADSHPNIKISAFAANVLRADGGRAQIVSSGTPRPR